MASNTQSLANTVGFELLVPTLAVTLSRSEVGAGRRSGFPDGTDPVHFRKALASSITHIETHSREGLLQNSC